MRRALWGCSILVAIGLLTAPEAAVAWGSDGHRAIGEIASHYLTPQARREVDGLLEPGAYGTLSAAGYWADAHARLYRTYDEWLRRHYVNVDPRAESVDLARDCPRDCILTAIPMLTASLLAGEPPSWLRAQDFRFLVHFVEDVHQPLHVAHPDGRGGNLTEVSLFGEEMNLHSVWDWGLIERRLRDYDSDEAGEPHTVAPWERWAFELRMQITPEEVARWSSSLDPLLWATESLVAARRLTFDVKTGDRLDEDYLDAALPLIDERIKMAAVRLAALLNDVFDEAPTG